MIISAVLFLAGAMTLWLWTPVLLSVRAGKPVMAKDDHVDVVCPACAYSLVGLRELRCPECGAQFTIDELIRSQHYAAPAAPLEAVKD